MADVWSKTITLKKGNYTVVFEEPDDYRSVQQDTGTLVNTDGDYYSIMNDYHNAVYPVIVFSGDTIENPKLTNLTTGEYIEPEGSWENTLRVDCERMLPDITGGHWFYLAPGINHIKLTGTVDTATLYWRARVLG